MKLILFVGMIYRYNKLSREVRELAERIKTLDPNDSFRNERGAQLLEKL